MRGPNWMMSSDKCVRRDACPLHERTVRRGEISEPVLALLQHQPGVEAADALEGEMNGVLCDPSDFRVVARKACDLPDVRPVHPDEDVHLRSDGGRHGLERGSLEDNSPLSSFVVVVFGHRGRAPGKDGTL